MMHDMMGSGMVWRMGAFGFAAPTIFRFYLHVRSR
jgi:hypothetical protein